MSGRIIDGKAIAAELRAEVAAALAEAPSMPVAASEAGRGVGETDGTGAAVAVAIGVFGFAEILRNLENEHDREVMTKSINRLLPTGAELRQMIGPVLRGTGIGAA